MRKKNYNKTYTNSLIELAAVSRVSSLATGGSQLSDYGTISWSNNYALITLNKIILTYLFTGNGIFQRAVQTPILDAISKSIELESDEASTEDINTLMDWWEENNLWDVILNYYTWARLYGGGGIIINTEQDPEKPFSVNSVNEKSLIAFYDIDRWMLNTTQSPEKNIEDVFFNFGDNDFYYLYGQAIHKSRVIVSTGKKAPAYVRRQLKGWGLSVAENMIRDLNNYLKTNDVLYEILDESKIDVYYIKDLGQKLATSGGINGVKNRIQAANEIKSYLNALLMDVNDKYEQKQMAFAGLAEVQRENRLGIASALNMPMTKLFGMSSAGFNSGEDDLENYNSMIESEIRPKLRPTIKKLLDIGWMKNFGYIPSYKISFPSLRLLSEIDEETVNTSKQNRILQLFDRGIITASKAVEMAKKEGLITIEVEESEIPDNPVPPGGSGSVDKISTDSPGASSGESSNKPTAPKMNNIKIIKNNKRLLENTGSKKR